ncbi:MAG: hypothetical protein M3Z22_00320 [Verrucomicrobiota bacterium]|nr:hypothetical protein [Verrucomicrobiota bacterium]
MNALTPSPLKVAGNTQVTFWRNFLTDLSLEPLGDLEKLLAGCEVIAALDDLHLLEI